MKIARIYLRVSTDEHDLTRHAGTFRPLRTTKEKFIAAA